LMTDSLNQPLRLAFAGTPEFAAQALDATLAAGYEVAMVFTQPERPAGRGMALQASAVKKRALAANIPVYQPRSLRLDGRHPDDALAAQAAMRAVQMDVMIVAAYGLILPAWVLQWPRLGCINIHASLLPRWRGAAPIHRAIEAGDSQTGICMMQMDEGLDTGGILRQQAIPIHAHHTTASLHDELAALGGQLLLSTLADLAQEPIIAQAQTSEGVCYAHKIEKSESAIDWTLPAEVIARRIRAFDPFPGASCSDGVETLKVWAADVVPEPTGAPPGTWLTSERYPLLVTCGQGALHVKVVQRPGGKRISAAAFVAGLGPHHPLWQRGE
jgi:methionyl-tRNA formyltransferase